MHQIDKYNKTSKPDKARVVSLSFRYIVSDIIDVPSMMWQQIMLLLTTANAIVSFIKDQDPRTIYSVFLYYHNKLCNNVQVSQMSFCNLPALVEKWIVTQYLWTAWNAHMSERTLVKIVSGEKGHTISRLMSMGFIRTDIHGPASMAGRLSDRWCYGMEINSHALICIDVVNYLHICPNFIGRFS